MRELTAQASVRGAKGYRCGDIQTVRGCVSNLSATGVGLLPEAELPRNEQFLLQLGPADGNRMLYSVVRCLPMPEGRFYLGAEFTCLVTSDGGPGRGLNAAEVGRIRRELLG